MQLSHWHTANLHKETAECWALRWIPIKIEIYKSPQKWKDPTAKLGWLSHSEPLSRNLVRSGCPLMHSPRYSVWVCTWSTYFLLSIPPLRTHTHTLSLSLSHTHTHTHTHTIKLWMQVSKALFSSGNSPEVWFCKAFPGLHCHLTPTYHCYILLTVVNVLANISIPLCAVRIERTSACFHKWRVKRTRYYFQRAREERTLPPEGQ